MVMCEFDQQLTDRGFIISKKLLFSNSKGLYIDLENKKWVLTGTNRKKLKRFDFSQIIECNLVVNKSSTVSGRSGGALIGGLVAGPVGAIIGGTGKRSVVEHTTSVCVNIVINDFDTPLLTFVASASEEDQARKLLALFTWMQENA